MFKVLATTQRLHTGQHLVFNLMLNFIVNLFFSAHFRTTVQGVEELRKNSSHPQFITHTTLESIDVSDNRRRKKMCELNKKELVQKKVLCFFSNTHGIVTKVATTKLIRSV